MRLRPLCFALGAAAALAVPIGVARAGDPAGLATGPLLVSPTTVAAPSPTTPDPSSYLALGLPAPPPPPARPTDHPIAGVDAPFEVPSATTVPAPTSTVAALAQNLTVQVERTDSDNSNSDSNSDVDQEAGGATSPTVLGNETTRAPAPSTTPFAFTGIRGLGLLAAAAAALLGVGALTRLAARRSRRHPQQHPPAS